jgi:hypothetical protein
MNEQQLLGVLAAFGVSNLANSLVAGITVMLAKNPNATDDDLLSEDDGTIKHAIRQKIGWLVDIVWPAVQPYVDQSIRAAIAMARGNAQGEHI